MSGRTYHGDSVTTGDRRLYRLYRKIKARCYDKKQAKYHLYGGAGVKMCDEWFYHYLLFKRWSYENGYASDLTIDRIDSKIGYEPKNCRWVSQAEQMRNTCRNVKYKGECALDASIRLGGTKHLVSNRMSMLGWSKEKAFTTKARIKIKK